MIVHGRSTWIDIHKGTSCCSLIRGVGELRPGWTAQRRVVGERINFISLAWENEKIRVIFPTNRNALADSITRPFPFVIISTQIYSGRPNKTKKYPRPQWYQQHHNLFSNPSTRIPKTEAQSWRSLGLTSLSLLVIHVKARAITYKHDTHLKCSSCMSPLLPLDTINRLILVQQNRQSCIGCKRFCCRREHVREESTTTFRGVLIFPFYRILVSNILWLISFQWYRHAHAKDMPIRAIARLIQTMLYARRFFPYYVYNILGGIEDDGELRCLTTWSTDIWHTRVKISPDW